MARPLDPSSHRKRYDGPRTAVCTVHRSATPVWTRHLAWHRRPRGSAPVNLSLCGRIAKHTSPTTMPRHKQRPCWMKGAERRRRAGEQAPSGAVPMVQRRARPAAGVPGRPRVPGTPRNDLHTARRMRASASALAPLKTPSGRGVARRRAACRTPLCKARARTCTGRRRRGSALHARLRRRSGSPATSRITSTRCHVQASRPSVDWLCKASG